MNANPEILNELLSISPAVAAIPRRNVYSVPDDYFKYFSDSVLLQLHPEISPSFGEGKRSAHTVPEGYFESLADSIMGRIKAAESTVSEETMKLSPAVAGIGNSNVFNVPEGYFESLSFLVSQRIPAPARVVNMKRAGIIRYMAAAVVTGLIGVSVFSLFDNKTSAGDELFPQQSEQVMEKAEEIIHNNSFEKELATITDKDIESYLTSNGEDVGAALVASITDDASQLPATDEYLTNDNTLDEFLDKMNLNN